jgi:predicted Rossmann-fold nucleotide-binding protein
MGKAQAAATLATQMKKREADLIFEGRRVGLMRASTQKHSWEERFSDACLGLNRSETVMTSTRHIHSL